MNAVELEHPTGAVLTAYGLGKLNEDALAGIDAHLAQCATCRQALEGVPPDTLLMLLRSAPTEPDSSVGNGALTASRSTLTQVAPPPALIDHPRYRVGELLGIGGMGAVYRAEHLLMERPVALKVLNPELIDKPATIDRFRREVRAAARLTHPNIVAAFDAEQAGNVHFLAMEYVEGVSLARLIAEKGPLPVAKACDYVRQAALGLQHAHERGMVHRDIKPQNLMLTPEGQVKILDFGLARFVMESVPAGAMLGAADAPTSRSDEFTAKPLTQTGIVMGTPDYIAPEQARDSHQADIRADIYSLGCTLYDLLAGHAPFPEGSAVQKVKAHLARAPKPLADFRHDVPPQLIKIIDRMMAKDPAERFPMPAEVAAALTPFVAAPSKPPRREKWPLVAAVLGFVAALVAGVIIYVQTDQGTIIIDTDDKTIAVMIENAGGVKIVDTANTREYLLKPGTHDVPRGEYQIEVTEALAGLDFQTTKFELKRGMEVRLTARFLPKAPGGVSALPKQASKDQGPLFAGKAADFWLERLKDADPTFRVEAVGALGNIAQKNTKLISVLVDSLKDKDYEVGKMALKALGSLGPDAKPAIPAMIDVLGEFEDSGTLTTSGGDAFTYEFSLNSFPLVLAGALKRIDPDIQDLPPQSGKGKTPNEAKQAALLQVQKAHNALKKRYQSQTADDGQASTVGGDLKKDREPLFAGKSAGFWVDELNDGSPKFRCDAVEALGVLAQKNEELIPVLVAALKDEAYYDASPKKRVFVGAAAAKALGALGPVAVPALIKVLKDKKSPTAISNAANALGQIGPKAKAALPLLTGILKAEDWGLRRAAISALGQIGPEAKPAIPGLVDALGDYLKSGNLLEAAQKVKTDNQPIFGFYSTPFGRYSVPVIIGQALSTIEPQVNDLLKVGSDNLPEDQALWQKVYDALKKKYPTQPASFWLNQFHDANPDFRVEAVEALGKIAQKNKDLIPILVGALKDTDREVAEESSRALASLGSEAVPALLEVLRDKTSPTAVCGAADAVGKIGRKAKAAVPLLSQALKMDDRQVRRSSISALGRIGPEAKPAIPAMIEALGIYLALEKVNLQLKAGADKDQFGQVFKGGKKGGKKGKGKGNLNPFGPLSLPVELLGALKEIDPELEGALPTAISPMVFRTPEESLALWQIIHDFLKIRYQTQKPSPPSDTRLNEAGA